MRTVLNVVHVELPAHRITLSGCIPQAGMGLRINTVNGFKRIVMCSTATKTRVDVPVGCCYFDGINLYRGYFVENFQSTYVVFRILVASGRDVSVLHFECATQYNFKALPSYALFLQ
jgi:hypothetical protein